MPTRELIYTATGNGEWFPMGEKGTVQFVVDAPTGAYTCTARLELSNDSTNAITVSEPAMRFNEGGIGPATISKGYPYAAGWNGRIVVDSLLNSTLTVTVKS